MPDTSGVDGAAQDANAKLFAEAHAKLADIYRILAECAEREQLTSPRGAPCAAMLRLEGFIGQSLEELVEAATFLFYLERGELMPYATLQEHLSRDSTMVRQPARAY